MTIHSHKSIFWLSSLSFLSIAQLTQPYGVSYEMGLSESADMKPSRESLYPFEGFLDFFSHKPKISELFV